MHDVHLTLGQAHRLVQHLGRLNLIPKFAKPFLNRVAVRLASGGDEHALKSGSIRMSTTIDADTLLIHWMDAWDSWDEEEAIRRSLPPTT
jgi:hypothetical protein